MEKEDATPCQAHSPPQIPQRPASQLLGSVHFDLRCGAFWKMKREPVAIFFPQNLRTSPSSGQATPNSLLRLPQLLACHSGAAFEGSYLRYKCLNCANVFFMLKNRLYRMPAHLRIHPLSIKQGSKIGLCPAFLVGPLPN